MTLRPPARDGRDDADHGILLDRCLLLLEVADIVITYKQINVAAELSLFIKQVLFEFRKIMGKLTHHAAHILCFDVELCRVVRELS